VRFIAVFLIIAFFVLFAICGLVVSAIRLAWSLGELLFALGRQAFEAFRPSDAA
jgi:hypothetical protein